MMSMSGAWSVAPLRSSSAVAKAPCESMQKKQSLAADVAVASISRCARVEGRAREVVDEQLVGEAAQVQAQPGRQLERGA